MHTFSKQQESVVKAENHINSLIHSVLARQMWTPGTNYTRVQIYFFSVREMRESLSSYVSNISSIFEVIIQELFTYTGTQKPQCMNCGAYVCMCMCVLTHVCR
jgi:hypothetical protein